MHRKGSIGGAIAKESAAKSRWKTLATTIQRIKKGGGNEGEPQSFRFPAFEVIDIRPEIAPANALNRLWFRVKAPDHPQVDLKVSGMLNSMLLVILMILLPRFASDLLSL